MAAVAEDSGEAAAAKNFDPNMKPKSEFDAHKLAEMFSNLNPLAKEFFPSSYSHHDRQEFQFYYQNNNRSSTKNFQVADQLLHSDNNRRVFFFSLSILQSDLLWLFLFWFSDDKIQSIIQVLELDWIVLYWTELYFLFDLAIWDCLFLL